MARRLEQYFASQNLTDAIGIQPRFKGCGILDSCYGDVLASTCLYEVKMVARNLHSVDLRQVLIYCALNYRSQQYAIDKVTVLNPRRGVEYRFTAEELCDWSAAKTPAELFHLITDFVCGFEEMRQSS